MVSQARAHFKLPLPLSRRRVVSLLLPVAVASALLTLAFNSRALPPPPRARASCASRRAPLHGGDCEAIGEPRRPSWACVDDMRRALPRFARLYGSRPVRNNSGGVMFDHAFALWYTMRMVRPKTVIESGAFRGLGTWLIRTALPTARIISLDPAPERRRLRGVEYLTGEHFQDFAHVDWAAKRVVPNETLVFLDDHQSSFRRMFRDNAHAFRRFIAEDNYAYLQGDNMSLKWVCERSRKALWQGSVRDDFGRKHAAQSWQQHVQLGEQLKAAVRTYYEFPPVASSALTHQTRFDVQHATPPIVEDRQFYERHLSKFGEREFAMYTHFCFVELEEDH